MKTIPGIRIWPPAKYPLIHKAKKIINEKGPEALDQWLESLSPDEREELNQQITALMVKAVSIAIESVLKDMEEGKLDL